MDSHAECLGHPFAARAAFLASPARIDSDQLTASLFRFAREESDELRPTRIVHGLGEHPSRQSLHIEILDRDAVVLLDDRSRRLVVEVSTHIGDVRVSLREEHPRVRPTL